MSQSSNPSDLRRQQILEAALQVFGRHGYRKASLDEVARLGGISRAGLYLHFPNKEVLFRSTLEYELDRTLGMASQWLADLDVSPHERIVSALDVWLGRYVGSAIATGIDDLADDNGAYLREMFAEYHAAFESRLRNALDALPWRNGSGPAAVDSGAATQVLIAVARGLKDHAETRQEFLDVASAAVHLVLGPVVAHAP